MKDPDSSRGFSTKSCWRLTALGHERGHERGQPRHGAARIQTKNNRGFLSIKEEGNVGGAASERQQEKEKHAAFSCRRRKRVQCIE